MNPETVIQKIGRALLYSDIENIIRNFKPRDRL